MKSITLITLCLLGALPLFSQPYSEGRHTRHRFAQLTLGAEVAYFPALGSTQYLNNDGVLTSSSVPGLISPRLSIGGLHFWGHADFAVAFPIAGMQTHRSDDLSSIYDPGISTMAKWYPWAVTRDAIRPYLGFSTQSFSFRQNRTDAEVDRGPWRSRIVTPLMAGLTLMKGNHLFELGAQYNLLQQEMAYPVSPSRLGTMTLPPLTISAGYKLMLETTAGSERNWQNGKTQQLTEELGSQLNGWFVGIGPSSSWMIGPSPALFGLPSVKTPLADGVFFDIVGGYYWHKPDLNLNLAWRRMRTSSSGYGLHMQQKRNSLALECTKYLVDYHGFAPFIGPALSLESLEVSFNSPQDQTYEELTGTVGITAGWDIRPSRLDWFYLRTNLRWFPNVSMTPVDGTTARFQNLEVNFIQFVWMIGRKR